MITSHSLGLSESKSLSDFFKAQPLSLGDFPSGFLQPFEDWGRRYLVRVANGEALFVNEKSLDLKNRFRASGQKDFCRPGAKNTQQEIQNVCSSQSS